MQPEPFRYSRGFATACALPAILAASPAGAQQIASAQLVGAAPLAFGLGAVGFGLLGLLLVRTVLRRAKLERRQTAGQVAALRAQIDQLEALVSSARELIVFWPGDGSEPRLLGQPAAVLPAGQLPESVLSFGLWLAETEAAQLAAAVEGLRVDGRSFELKLKARDGRAIRAFGALTGGSAALRLRPAGDGKAPASSAETACDLIAALAEPAFLRDGSNRLICANEPYLALGRALGKTGTRDRPPEILDAQTLRSHLAAHVPGSPLRTECAGRTFDLVTAPMREGRAGVLRPAAAQLAVVPRQAAPAEEPPPSNLNAVIDALWVPVAIFDRNRELVRANHAYAHLWGLDPSWLRPGIGEREILDRLRTEGKLPSDPDYHTWRKAHLDASYGLKGPQELAPWHLPDGRTVSVIAAPGNGHGGVIYIFEDITERLDLESRNKALLDVQRSTINSLTEAVAVFGTNGRLTLANPRLSAIWKLPLNQLGKSPHIDEIAAASARALPEDGAAIWRDLKRAVIDLRPGREDRTGRISRADGRLLDYAVVRLPDGQTMITFLDVTDSANYSRVLKERNDALVTADRLKDAFVQNVSYELRSPLTNIIGFADLLASGTAGPLTERQREYTGYIRASSETLGVLIDNILDLATVDAGIAELNPAPQDVAHLVEKARAGLLATFPAVEGQQPLDFSVDVPDDLPPFVADGTRVVQVLYNLLATAVRFSEQGAPIRLWVRARAERMIFTIEDSGSMSEEVRAAILERGADPEVTGRQRGAGLGLAIVRAFVSLHGGSIGVESEPGRGSVFTVRLPRSS